MTNRKRKLTQATANTSAASKRARPKLRFYGDEFVLDTVSGMFYRISPTASFILRSLDEGVEPEPLAAELQRRYRIDRSTAVRDIELLRNDLASIEPLSEARA